MWRRRWCHHDRCPFFYRRGVKEFILETANADAAPAKSNKALYKKATMNYDKERPVFARCIGSFHTRTTKNQWPCKDDSCGLKSRTLKRQHPKWVFISIQSCVRIIFVLMDLPRPMRINCSAGGCQSKSSKWAEYEECPNSVLPGYRLRPIYELWAFFFCTSGSISTTLVRMRWRGRHTEGFKVSFGLDSKEALLICASSCRMSKMSSLALYLVWTLWALF